MSKLNILLAATLIGTALLVGCAGDTQSFKQSFEGQQTQEGGGQKETPPSCYIYPLYAVGACSALILRSSLTGSAKVEYTYPNSNDSRYKAPTHLIDLQKIRLEANITRNFTLGEYMSPAKGQFGYVLEPLFAKIQSIRDQIGNPLKITSAYRSPAYNKRVGGVKFSRHIYGDGVDMSSEVGLNNLKDACRSANASFIQLYNDGHIHCDWRNLPSPLAVVSTEAEFAATQQAISGAPKIMVSGKPRYGKKIRLKARLASQEDPGVLYTEWIVISPKGNTQTTDEPILSFKPSERGSYQIMVRVGGYAEASYILEIL